MMMKWKFGATLAVLSLLALPGPVISQSRAQVEITPRIGYYSPLEQLGPSAPAGSIWVLRLDKMEPAASLDLMVRAAWQGTRVATRLGGFYTLPASARGTFDCAPGQICPEVLLTTNADVSIIGGVADVLVFALHSGSAVRPYALVGGGFKRYSFDWPDAAALVEAGSHTETTLTAHFGAGLELDLFGLGFRAELADFWSPQGEAIRASPGAAAARRNAQHDLALSLGLRVLQF